MEYKVNVAVGGIHYCSIILAADCNEDAKKQFKNLRSIFPEQYELTLCCWRSYGEYMETED